MPGNYRKYMFLIGLLFDLAQTIWVDCPPKMTEHML